jgi:hypothetical protein
MTWPPVFLGTLLEMIGTGMIALSMYRQHSPSIFGFMAMVGAGMGLKFMAAPLHGVGLFRNHRATIIALMALAVPLGGTIGLTIMSTVLNNVSGLSSAETDFMHLHGGSGDIQEESVQNIKV